MTAEAGRPDSEAHQLSFRASSTLHAAVRQVDRALRYGVQEAAWEDVVDLLSKTAVDLRGLQKLAGIATDTAQQLPPCPWCGRPTADVVDDRPGHPGCKARSTQRPTTRPARTAQELTQFGIAIRTRFADATDADIATLLTAAATTLETPQATAPPAPDAPAATNADGTTPAPTTPTTPTGTPQTSTETSPPPQTSLDTHPAPAAPTAEPAVIAGPTRRPGFTGDDEELEIATRTIRHPDAFPDATDATDATDADIAAALSLFHAHLTVKGTPTHLVRSPAHTGTVLLERLIASEGNMVMPSRLVDETVWDITKTNLVRPLGFVTPDLELRAGMSITQTDCNAQFLAVSEIPLGDGEPRHYDLDEIRQLPAKDREMLVKSPGYARIGDVPDLSKCPIWVQVSLQRLAPGTWIPLPVVAYLRERGTRLPIDMIIGWPTGHRGPRLRVWGRHVKDARAALMTLGVESTPVLYALHLVKAVYSAFLGGELRSKDHNTSGTLRPDWNDMIVAVARCNVFRALDRHAAPKDNNDKGFTPLGGITDSLWWSSDGPEPFTPPGWEMPANRQPGKWKRDRHVEVTEEIIAAYSTGSYAQLNKAIKTEWEERTAA